MSVGAFEMGCGCGCSDCVYFTDSFQRSDSSSLGSDWTEIAGDWEINSNSLYTEDSDAIVQYSGDTINTRTYVGLTVIFEFTDNGDELKIYVKSDYYIKITAGSSGRVSFHKADDTEIGYRVVTIDTGVSHTLELNTYFNVSQVIKIDGEIIISALQTTSQWDVKRLNGLPLGTGTISNSIKIYKYELIKPQELSLISPPAGIACIEQRLPWVRMNSSPGIGSIDPAPPDVQIDIVTNTGELDGSYVTNTRSITAGSSNFSRTGLSIAVPGFETVNTISFRVAVRNPALSSTPLDELMATFEIQIGSDVTISEWGLANPTLGNSASVSINFTLGASATTGTATITYDPDNV